MDNEEEINRYIEKLRKKYKIRVEEIYIRWYEPYRPNMMKKIDDFFKKNWDDNYKLFKIIKVGRKNELLKKSFAKERQIFISLDNQNGV